MNPLTPIFLPPLSAVYGAITRSRLRLYRSGAFRTSALPAPVISIGNITTGGTGKTPLVEWVARTLANNGRKVCILTRGYGRKNPAEQVLVSDGKALMTTPSEAGDEAFLLAQRLLGKAAVVSNADRLAAGQGAIKHLGSNCFVLDDGFQHLRLARDLNIVTVDAMNPWGGGHLLPYGRLREPLTELSRADCVVLTRVDQVETIEPILKKLAQLTGGRPIFSSRMLAVGFEPLRESADDEEHSRCFAFCGIGNPQSFFAQLALTELQVAGQKTFADHQDYAQKDIDGLVASAKQAGATCLVTTEKDAVKLRPYSVSLPCYFLRIEIAIENAEQLKELIIAATKRTENKVAS